MKYTGLRGLFGCIPRACWTLSRIVSAKPSCFHIPTEKLKQKLAHQRFRKRAHGIFKKAEELRQIYGAKISVIIQRSNGQPYAYHSLSSPSWSPTRKQIENACPLALRAGVTRRPADHIIRNMNFGEMVFEQNRSGK